MFNEFKVMLEEVACGSLLESLTFSPLLSACQVGFSLTQVQSVRVPSSMSRGGGGEGVERPGWWGGICLLHLEPKVPVLSQRWEERARRDSPLQGG